jgi:hypothetical protein
VQVGPWVLAGVSVDQLAAALEDVEADWIVSYGELPPVVQEQAETILDRTVRYQMGASYNGESDPSTETLAMSYQPASTPSFIDASTAQATLVQADGGETAKS